MNNYLFTNKAVKDLSNIYTYTFKKWSEAQADKYYHEIILCCQKIANNPRIGRRYKNIHPDVLGYLINKHIIFYSIISDREIQIIRILGAIMDLKYRINE
ncbi:type II toxin-antitoxin system RelE/ParE family toxin [Sphingobacterium hungaricum]